MASLTRRIENLSEEELDQLLEAGDQIDIERQSLFSPAEVKLLFEYLSALTIAGRHEDAAKVFMALKPSIDALVADETHHADGLEYLEDWALHAIRLVPERMDSFVCLPIYRELIEAYSNGPEHLQPRAAKARIQMVFHADFWEEKVGKLEDLPESERQEILDARAIFMDEVNRMIATCEEKGYHDELLGLHRALARMYAGNAKPNDAIAHLKAIVEVLPKTKDYHEVDLGELYIEIGRLFFTYKKYAVAKKYFVQAFELFQNLGEDYEGFAFKAEGWVEECDRLL